MTAAKAFALHVLVQADDASESLLKGNYLHHDQL